MASHPPASSTAFERSPWQLLGAFVVVLILAQALIGALSLSALNHEVKENTSDRIALKAQQTVDQIQAGLVLGKPLQQYFGLENLLAQLVKETPGVAAVEVLGRDKQPILRVAASPGKSTPSTASALTITRPLLGSQDEQHGYLVLYAEDGIEDAAALYRLNGLVLLAITAVAALLMGVVLRRRQQKILPVLILFAAQLAYAGTTIYSFQTTWLSVSHENAQTLAQGVKRDLDKVLSYGLAPESVSGTTAYLQRVIGSFPLIQEIQLQDERGDLLLSTAADAHPVETADIWMALQEDGQKTRQLALIFDQGVLKTGAISRVIDAATVALISLITTFELFRLLDLLVVQELLQRPWKRLLERRQSGSASPRFARPIVFGLTFAWALPFGFLPLYARSLIEPETAKLSLQVLMALPIAAEMGLSLFGVLLASRLMRLYRWTRPVAWGLLAAVIASLACAWVTSLWGLVFARMLVGVGYGLAWMGLQGFVVLESPAHQRGHYMTQFIAGLFAGHLSGVAIGAMVMQQLGYSLVFELGAVLFCLPLLAVLWLQRRYSLVAVNTMQSTPAPTRPTKGERFHATGQLLRNRAFIALLLAAVVPFAFAQVGLLTFAVPLYLDKYGASAASAGRVLMIYGLCIIYVGPWLGRLADGSQRRKLWLVLAGLLGSVSLLLFWWLQGIAAMVLAVFLLAASGCVGGAAQTPYLLGLPAVQQYGAVGATSIMRAFDKLGQMVGPLLMGGLFALLSMEFSLIVVGLLYLLATVGLFILIPRDDGGLSGQLKS